MILCYFDNNKKEKNENVNIKKKKRKFPTQVFLDAFSIFYYKNKKQ